MFIKYILWNYMWKVNWVFRTFKWRKHRGSQLCQCFGFDSFFPCPPSRFKRCTFLTFKMRHCSAVFLRKLGLGVNKKTLGSPGKCCKWCEQVLKGLLFAASCVLLYLFAAQWIVGRDRKEQAEIMNTREILKKLVNILSSWMAQKNAGLLLSVLIFSGCISHVTCISPHTE